MNREEKAATIEALATKIEESQAIFAVDYRGISVPQAAELRAKLREADAAFTVVKNSLTERAADQAGVADLKELLSGPTALTFVRGDVAIAAKAVADYARATQLLPFKGGVMDGTALDAEQIRSLSRLPSRDVLYGQLVGVVASPLTGLVRTLNALISGLAVALGQIRDQGLIGATAAPAEPEAAAPAVEGEPAGEARTEAAEQADGEADAEQPSAETAESSEAEQETEPGSEPANDDNQADASADDQSGTAEATKED